MGAAGHEQPCVSRVRPRRALNTESARRTLVFPIENIYNTAVMQWIRIGDVELGVFTLPAGPARWPETLSACEREVAHGLLRGRSHREIADDRGVSEATVDQQLRRVFAKLGVESGAELTRILAREE